MYLHIGKDIVINDKEIISILNLNYVKNTKTYKKMYKNLEEKKAIINIADNKEKTFILTKEKSIEKAYISNISVNTLIKRVI